MAPDRQTPATNDNAAVDVPAMMAKALKYFPQRQDFRWAASDAREGATPPYTSMLFPFGGFAALRNGWGRGDNMLYFDFGPIGYMHAHQDKLNVILWAHGRQILFDSGRSNYDEFPRYQHYAMDTYSHNTVLVDDRPQRRAPGRPNPDQTPYKQLTDFQSELTPQYDYVAGVYDGKYGKPHSDPDAYEKGSDFADDNVEPATHHRRVIFYKPDVFVIADTLIARDQQSHTYDTRWQLDSTEVTLASDGQTAFTADADQPNLEVIPLLTAGLTVKKTTAQKEPHLLGWKFWSKPLPATTLQHLKSGPDTVQFATLLLPLKPGQTSLVQSAKAAGPSSFEFTLRDGRHFRLEIPPDPAKKITLTPMTP
jgi:hypothetical protein